MIRFLPFALFAILMALVISSSVQACGGAAAGRAGVARRVATVATAPARFVVRVVSRR